MSVTWLYSRSSSSSSARIRCASSGTLDAEGVLDGQAVGQRVADGGVAADAFGQFDRAGWAVRPSKSFSMPRWTNHSRALSLRMVSPTTEKRKWPGSISPACTGPTGIS